MNLIHDIMTHDIRILGFTIGKSINQKYCGICVPNNVPFPLTVGPGMTLLCQDDLQRYNGVSV